VPVAVFLHVFYIAGVEVSTAAFPADDLAYGFDTVGEAMTFSTLHFENYLAAAREVAAACFDVEDPRHTTVRPFEAELMEIVEGRRIDMHAEIALFCTTGEIEQRVSLPRDGLYRLRVHAGADQAGEEAAKMAVSVDGRQLRTFEVAERRAATFELEVQLRGGVRRIALAFVNDFFDPKSEDRRRRDRNLRADWLEVVGPLDVLEVPECRAWLHDAVSAGDAAGSVRAVAEVLLPRVWRRPATENELAASRRLGLEVLAAGEPLEVALRAMLQASLCSPHFLFRFEDPEAGAGYRTVYYFMILIISRFPSHNKI
jgi:hypothetical protein